MERALAAKSILISLTDRDIAVPAYGPYDVTGLSLAPTAQRDLSCSGILGKHYDDTFAAAVTDAFYQDVLAQAKGFAESDYEPFATWIKASASDKAQFGSVANIQNRIVEQLIAASDLASVRGALESWGLTAEPLAEYSETEGWSFRPRVLPVYPLVKTVSGAEVHAAQPFYQEIQEWSGGAPSRFSVPYVAATPTVDLSAVSAWATIDAYPGIEIPDAYNEPGDYQTRRIAIEDRNIGQSNVLLLSRGSVRPSVLLQQSDGGNVGYQREEMARWGLQNESVRMTLARALTDDWPVSTINNNALMLKPGVIARLPPHSRPPAYSGAAYDRWLVRQVEHRWSESAGFTQAAQLTLWQGGFYRREV